MREVEAATIVQGGRGRPQRARLRAPTRNPLRSQPRGDRGSEGLPGHHADHRDPTCALRPGSERRLPAEVRVRVIGQSFGFASGLRKPGSGSA
jgi:hypothetical protein